MLSCCSSSKFFRFKKENRTYGSLQGENSTDLSKTFPTIEVVVATSTSDVTKISTNTIGSSSRFQFPLLCIMALVEHTQPHRIHHNYIIGGKREAGGLVARTLCSTIYFKFSRSFFLVTGMDVKDGYIKTYIDGRTLKQSFPGTYNHLTCVTA